jgi:hypothetical protein
VTRARLASLALALVLLPLAPLRASAQLEDEMGEDDDTRENAPADSTEQSPAPSEADTQAESNAAAETESPAQAQDGEAPPEVLAPSEPEATAGRAIKVQAGAGFGFGTLSYVRPTAAGTQKLPNTPFAAAEFLLRTRIRPEAAFSLDVLLYYQTSVGLQVQLDPLFALPEDVDARSQRGEASIAPVLRLGGASSNLAIAFPVGFALRSFAPRVHQYDIADYILGGALVRPELRLQLGEWVDLQAGPELQWLFMVDSSLRDEGACCQGFAVGGQGAVQARVGENLRVALAYRQSHAFVPAGGWRFKDVERFLTVRVGGEL